MKNAIIGKKIGMTRLYNEKTGSDQVVTVVDVSDNVISNILKSGDVITHIEIGKDKKVKPNKAELGKYKELKFVPIYKKAIKSKDDGVDVKVGDTLGADVFAEGDLVDVQGVTKGKGFSGVVKRWGFKGGPKTHGQSDRHRAPGSIGSGTTPGRVVKGKKMAGRMGREKQTVQRLIVTAIDTENKIIAVQGSVPGFNGAYLLITKAKKQK